MVFGINYSSYKLVLFIIVSIASPIAGQVFDDAHEYLSVEDGLPDNLVQSLLQDSTGRMWFATSVMRFEELRYRSLSAFNLSIV